MWICTILYSELNVLHKYKLASPSASSAPTTCDLAPISPVFGPIFLF